MGFDDVSQSGLLIVGFFDNRTYVINILFENGSDYERKRGEDKIVKWDIDIVENCLCWETTVECENELRDGKQHIFVEEVENHLSNTDIVPSAVD